MQECAEGVVIADSMNRKQSAHMLTRDLQA